jgi:hypothetical protein
MKQAIHNPLSLFLGWGVLFVMCFVFGAGFGASAKISEFKYKQLSIYYRSPGDMLYLQAVTQLWDTASQDLAKLNLTIRPITLVAASSAADFAHQTGQPASIAAITVGQTIYSQRLAALAQRRLLTNTLRHEFFHALQPKTLPLWLAEGLARIFSGEAKADPSGPTSLANSSQQQLDTALRQREPQQLRQAYIEASQRARLLLNKLGWAKVLGQ